jgi:hypothetical protein
MSIAETIVVGVGTTEANSEAFSYGDATDGMLIVPSTEAATVVLSFWASDKEDGTYHLVSNTLATTTDLTVTGVVNKAKPFPPELAGAAWLKITAATISGGTRIKYRVMLKRS